jgi:hypothetical protein
VKQAFQANHVFGGCTTCMALTFLVTSHMMLCTLALWVFKKYVHMLVKYAIGNGKIKDLDGVLQIVKTLSPTTL